MVGLTPEWCFAKDLSPLCLMGWQEEDCLLLMYEHLHSILSRCKLYVSRLFHMSIQLQAIYHRVK